MNPMKLPRGKRCSLTRSPRLGCELESSRGLRIDAEYNEARRRLECGAVVTQLSGAIQPPAGNGSVGGLRTGMRVAGRDRPELEASGDGGRRRPRRRGAIAELAEIVRAPAVGTAVGGQRAGMGASDTQCSEDRRAGVGLRR